MRRSSGSVAEVDDDAAAAVDDAAAVDGGGDDTKRREGMEPKIRHARATSSTEGVEREGRGGGGI
jgi:hypothetical protein